MKSFVITSSPQADNSFSSSSTVTADYFSSLLGMINEVSLEIDDLQLSWPMRLLTHHPPLSLSGLPKARSLAEQEQQKKKKKLCLYSTIRVIIFSLQRDVFRILR
jgi:hypothetical protein